MRGLNAGNGAVGADYKSDNVDLSLSGYKLYSVANDLAVYTEKFFL